MNPNFQYGFRPPHDGPVGPYGPGSRIPGVRPILGSGPPAPTNNADNDKLNTLFVGAIAPGISDEWIETLLKTCGNLKHWKRTVDPSGKPKGFGFATYADPDSVLCALRVLGGEKTDGVTLKALDGSGVEKKLIVKADDNVRRHLDGYQQQRQQRQDDSKDQEIYGRVQNYVSAIFEGQQEPELESAVDKELAMFKERAEQNDRRSEERRHRSNERSSSSSKRGDHHFVKGPTEYHSYASQQDMATDEEIEKRRREKHERDVENAYHQREKRFEQRESLKLKEYTKDLKREIELEEREPKEREYWLERLANWDDEVEMVKGEEPYYVDRSRWRRMRESQRRREEEKDEEDRRKEAQEIKEENARIEEEEKARLAEERRKQEIEEQRRREGRFLNRDREGEQAKIALKPTKLNFNIPIKRNTLGGADEDEEEEAKKKRRVLVPLDYGDLETSQENDTENLSAEEKTKKVKELIEMIPSSQQDLWAYDVKWNELDEELINTKLHPFISKKIVDLLGMEEDDLVNFVLRFIREKKGPDALVTELEGALDEDALVFVMKLWRALIFETERKSRKL